MEKSNILSRWAAFCIKNYKVTILVIIALIIAGTWGIFTNQRQDFPTIPANYIFVNTFLPGATAQDINQNIITPYENELKSIEGVKTIRSNATANSGFIHIELENADNTKEKAAEVNEIIDSINVPENTESSAQLLDITGPTIAFAFTSDTQSQEELLGHANKIKDFLATSSKGVKKIELIPEPEFETEIILDADKLKKEGIAHQEVTQTIKGYLQAIPGGTLKKETEEQPISIAITINNLEDLKTLPIRNKELQDIAEIKRAPKNNDAITLAGYLNSKNKPESKEAVYFMIYKNEDGDIITISKELTAAITEMKEKGIIPQGTSLNESYNTAPIIADQIQTLINNGAIGLIIILIVLLLMINLRTAIVVALILPFTFLIGLFLLPVLGFTLNILTLFALILTLGIIVDNAIVIAEGIAHNLERGLGKKDSAIQAVRDYGLAITAATLTTIIVFIPMANIGGIMGEFLKYIPFTIIIMLIGSYFLGMTITPLLSTWIMKKEENKKMPKWQKFLVIPYVIVKVQKAINCLSDIYGRFIRALLAKKSYRVATIITTIFAIIISFGYFGSIIEFEQFPEEKGAAILVTPNVPANYTQEEIQADYEQIGEQIITVQEFKGYFFMQNMFYVLLTEPTERTTDIETSTIVEDLDVKIKRLNKKYEIPVASGGSGPPTSEFDTVVEFKGSDQESLRAAGKDLTAYLKTQASIKEVTHVQEENKKEVVTVTPNKKELQKYGLAPFTIAQVLQSYFGTTPAGEASLVEDATSDTLSIRYNKESQSSIQNIKETVLITPQGQPVLLSAVADIEKVTQDNTIAKLNGERVETVNAKLKDDVDKVVFEQSIKDYLSDSKLNSFKLTQDNVSFGGAQVEMQSSQNDLILVFILAMIGVYLVLVHQFHSFGQPFIIMLTIPIALIGVFPGLIAVGSSINMIAGLGIIALVGIVVNDAIVFIDYYNRLRKAKPQRSLQEHLAKTGKARFKPILTTSITTIAGILPLTIRDPFWIGLGTSMIAGLIFSTVGTLIAIPAFMHWFTQKNKKK